jgi:hypothetical protein
MDGLYDPCRPNDPLLPGMKGGISKFEFGVLRARMLDPPAPRRGVVSCASAGRSATSGIARLALALIRTCGSRK